MTQTDIPNEFKLDTPATYRIRVQGRLDRSWADLLNNMQIEPDTGFQKTKVTTLIGYLPDQAALSGVLNTLYDRQVPLLSVEILDEKKEDR
jgi:hypothetical protein